MSVNAAVATLVASALLAGAKSDRLITQTPAGQARQQEQIRLAGTGSIAGLVTSADGAPLSRARVTLRSAVLPQPRVTVTDARGGFKFERLAPAEYEIGVTRTGFALPYAAGGPVRGVVVRLGEGQDRAGLNLALQRAGTIAGRLLDEDGSPLGGAEIEALSLRSTDEQQSLLPVSAARSDDRGEFRLTGLPAGQYIVLARDPAFTNVGDGSGVVRYAPTYFPGVVTRSEAQPISIAEGRESPQLEFRLRIVRASRIAGAILAPDRRPLTSGAVILVPREGSSATPLASDDVEILPDGRFMFRNVPPGQYQIRARAETGPNDPMLFGSFAVTVGTDDITNFSMPLVTGAVVQGMVDWDRGAKAPPSGLRVRAPFFDGSSFGDSLTGEIASNGSFSIRGVMPGAHYVVVEGLSEPWAVTGVHLRGRNVLDQPTDLHPGEKLQDVRIVISASTSELSGAVRDEKGKPTIDALVVTLPPSLLWMSPASPRFRLTRTDKEGRYRFRGLPGGDYKVAAISGMDELVIRRREWLQRLNVRAVPVAVGAQDSRTLDLVAIDVSALVATVTR
jgi:hypothetical protein